MSSADLGGTLNSCRRGAVSGSAILRFQAEGVLSAPVQEGIKAVGGRYCSPLDRTAQATRASLLAAAVITTLIGDRRSRALSHGPNGDRSRLTRSTADRAPCTSSFLR